MDLFLKPNGLNAHHNALCPASQLEADLALRLDCTSTDVRENKNILKLSAHAHIESQLALFHLWQVLVKLDVKDPNS